MSDRIRIFEVILKGRGRKWVWSVRTTAGKAIMMGAESSRQAASYEANRALFLLLSLRHIDLGSRLARSAEDYSLPDRQARINPVTPFRPSTPASGEVSSAIATRWDFGQA